MPAALLRSNNEPAAGRERPAARLRYTRCTMEWHPITVLNSFTFLALQPAKTELFRVPGVHLKGKPGTRRARESWDC
jgi:hypothetical protein